MLVECKPCFAIDTLCALAHNQCCREDIAEIKSYIESVGEDLDIFQSVWYLNIVLAKNIPFSQIEKLTLLDLQKIYPPLMDTHTHERLISSKPDVTTAFERMVLSNFQQKWEDMCLPEIKKCCDDFIQAAEKIDFRNIFSDIKKLKASDKVIDKVLVYISYFSNPTSFKLSSNTYVTWCKWGERLDNKELICIMIHELSHGLLKKETEKLYVQAINNDAFLNQTNWYLTKILGSSNEEEFVVSMEHAISVKNGIESYADSKHRIFSHYGSCMPIAVIIFDLLIKEKVLPYDLNAWLIDCFESKKIRVGKIREQVDSILLNYSDTFFKTWNNDETRLNSDRVYSYI